MGSKTAMIMVMMVMTVMPVSPRPHQAKEGSGKIESAVSESLKDIETAILGSARKIESVIEETIHEKVLEESANRKKQEVAVIPFAAINSDINKKAVFRSVLAKIFARKHGGATKGAAPSMAGSSRDDTATTTTMDPLDEYCKEACEAGIGGPECDCPDHPIG